MGVFCMFWPPFAWLPLLAAAVPDAVSFLFQWLTILLPVPLQFRYCGRQILNLCVRQSELAGLNFLVADNVHLSVLFSMARVPHASS